MTKSKIIIIIELMGERIQVKEWISFREVEDFFFLIHIGRRYKDW